MRTSTRKLRLAVALPPKLFVAVYERTYSPGTVKSNGVVPVALFPIGRIGEMDTPVVAPNGCRKLPLDPKRIVPLAAVAVKLAGTCAAVLVATS